MQLEDLKARASRGEFFRFTMFWGPQNEADHVTESCLSQWYPAPFARDGVRYLTAEHWMMAEKARLFGDAAMLERILATESPREAKQLGGLVRRFDESTWKAHRFEIVVRGNMSKFSQNPALLAFLEQTGEAILVEASPVDRVWGIGLARHDERAHNPLTWRGLNLLGFALMQARERLRASTGEP